MKITEREAAIRTAAPSLARSSFTTIQRCRVCGNTELAPVLDLGDQVLTGVFPKHATQGVTRGPLRVVKCHGDESACGLVQLRHSYRSAELYGDGYGYRSSLNSSMVQHLREKAATLADLVVLEDGDIVLDIGSNDGTTLGFFSSKLKRVGIDPTISRFGHLYPTDIEAIPDFFSADLFKRSFGSRKAKIVTSIAMFYDLESPLQFVEQIAEVLDSDGIWHFEQSYMPRMLEQTAYDTICHEHLEYYGLRQIEWILSRCGMVIQNVELNDVNGGSFAVTATRQSSRLRPVHANIESVMQNEAQAAVATLAPFERFASRASAHRAALTFLLDELTSTGAKVLGYGASTKGNVILQYCGITAKQLPFVAEINSDKFGCFTPGSNIPIISEADAHAMKPDYMLVLPWHFRHNLIARERKFLARGGRLIFPLPAIEIV